MGAQGIYLVVTRMMNFPHARPEIGQFCAEVTHSPARTYCRATKKPLLAG